MLAASAPEALMRISRYFAPASVLILLLWGSVALAQTVPATAVPFITQVSPPSFLPTATAPGNGNFMLTILGENFQSNSVVTLSFPGDVRVRAADPPGKAGVSQAVTIFTTALPPTAATLL